MDPGASVLVATADLKDNTKQKHTASFVEAPRTFIPKIMCLFIEDDFMNLLHRRPASGDTPSLFEGWVCVWICCEEGRCSRLCGWGWGGQGGGEEGPRKLPLWRGCDHPWRVRVREVSQNGTRREEGAAGFNLKNTFGPGVGVGGQGDT